MDEPSDETLQAALEAWYGKPYPAGDNVQKDKADMRKVAAILLAAQAKGAPQAPSGDANV